MVNVLYQYRKDDEGKLLEFIVIWPNIKLTFQPLSEGYMMTRKDHYKTETCFLSDADFEQQNSGRYHQVLESIMNDKKETPPSTV